MRRTFFSRVQYAKYTTLLSPLLFFNLMPTTFGSSPRRSDLAVPKGNHLGRLSLPTAVAGIGVVRCALASVVVRSHQGSARLLASGLAAPPGIALPPCGCSRDHALASAATSAPLLVSRARARPSSGRISDRDLPAVAPPLAPLPPFPLGAEGRASPDLRPRPTNDCRRGQRRW
jgi:hypothetical protein